MMSLNISALRITVLVQVLWSWPPSAQTPQWLPTRVRVKSSLLTTLPTLASCPSLLHAHSYAGSSSVWLPGWSLNNQEHSPTSELWCLQFPPLQGLFSCRITHFLYLSITFEEVLHDYSSWQQLLPLVMSKWNTVFYVFTYLPIYPHQCVRSWGTGLFCDQWYTQHLEWCQLCGGRQSMSAEWL